MFYYYRGKSDHLSWLRIGVIPPRAKVLTDRLSLVAMEQNSGPFGQISLFRQSHRVGPVGSGYCTNTGGP